LSRAHGSAQVRTVVPEEEPCDEGHAEVHDTRYATFGLSHEANVDEGAMWPTAFALTELTAADETRIGALVKQAVS
jgi:hypothetical protein